MQALMGIFPVPQTKPWVNLTSPLLTSYKRRSFSRKEARKLTQGGLSVLVASKYSNQHMKRWFTPIMSNEKTACGMSIALQPE